jgi:hypothetical protein
MLCTPQLPAIIIATLAHDDTAAALGIVVTGPSPVLQLCRRLIEIGHDPDRPLQAWRGSTLALRVSSIGEAAELEIGSKGTGFIRRPPRVRRGSPAQNSDLAATPTREAAE